MSEPIKFHRNTSIDSQVWDAYAEIAFKELLKQDLDNSRAPTVEHIAQWGSPTLSKPEDVAELTALYADAMLTEERKRRP